MKFNVYLKNKGILKIIYFCSKLVLTCGSWLIVSEGQLSAGRLFSVLRVDGFYLIFILTTTSVDHNDRKGHFVQRIFLVLVLKINVKKEI